MNWMRNGKQFWSQSKKTNFIDEKIQFIQLFISRNFMQIMKKVS